MLRISYQFQQRRVLQEYLDHKMVHPRQGTESKGRKFPEMRAIYRRFVIRLPQTARVATGMLKESGRIGPVHSTLSHQNSFKSYYLHTI